MWKALIKLVEKWAYRCDHNWEFVKEVNVYFSSNSELPYKTKLTYRCTKCCKFKKIIA